MSLQGNAEGTALKGKINKLIELHGYSAYEIALIHGFKGTEEEWLASLVPVKGKDYFTEEDINSIVPLVLDAMPQAEEMSV